MIRLSENLRTLRKNADMTQEEVAGALSVSPQTVSKWERQETLPDISLLPSLANLFGVTTDRLLGMDEINAEKTRAGIFSTAHELLREGERAAAAEIYEDALKLYPADYGIMSDLAIVLAMASDEKSLLRAVHLCEKLLNSKASKVRHTTAAAYCYLLGKLGRHEEAARAAKELPHQRESREVIQSDLAAGLSMDALNDRIRTIILG